MYNVPTTSTPLYHQTNTPLYHQTIRPLHHQTNTPLYHQTNTPLYHQTNTPLYLTVITRLSVYTISAIVQETHTSIITFCISIPFITHYILLNCYYLTSPSNSICTLETPYTVFGLIIVKSGHNIFGESGPKAPIVLGQKRRKL